MAAILLTMAVPMSYSVPTPINGVRADKLTFLRLDEKLQIKIYTFGPPLVLT